MSLAMRPPRQVCKAGCFLSCQKPEHIWRSLLQPTEKALPKELVIRSGPPCDLDHLPVLRWIDLDCNYNDIADCNFVSDSSKHIIPHVSWNKSALQRSSLVLFKLFRHSSPIKRTYYFAVNDNIFHQNIWSLLCKPWFEKHWKTISIPFFKLSQQQRPSL